jgi:pimeloyl-ACP methyl ester carboxylesterase
MMSLRLPKSDEWAARCAVDGEFQLAARHWSGGLRIGVGDVQLGLTVVAGQVSGGVPQAAAGVLTLDAPLSLWEKMLAANPPRFFNDISAAWAQGLKRGGDRVVHAQYFAAVMRAIELLRAPGLQADPLRDEAAASGTLDAPVGRYVHVNLDGHDHRIYFEEAGQGIPLLLQHTAGCHGSQWRHLFEYPEITDHFRLIAYDLPYHGKSLPPIGKDWWSEPYQLRGGYLRGMVLALSQALGLENPAFMGCSVGGLLALDLAARHPEAFRAVISLEGALRIGGDMADYSELWHPQISNEYKARLMDGIMAPASPAAYRKETSFVYAAGWPPVFLGDLHYYVSEYDLRDAASSIDTNQVGVHILSGEYDYSGTAELGRAAHEAIAGSTWSEMRGLGHFPMSENPVRFMQYLLPVLARIRAS